VFDAIDKITSLFEDFHIIVAYDASTDKTLLKLAYLKRKYGSKMDVIVNKGALSRIRTQNIANARNALLAKMRELNYGWPMFIMMDMDDVCDGPLDLEVLKRALDRESEWDSVSFNRPGYYDIWALSIKPFLYSVWGWSDPKNAVLIMREFVVSKLSALKKDEWLRCESAFNGFALYKTDVFLKCVYDWRRPVERISEEDFRENREALGNRNTLSPFNRQTDEPDCEHRPFHMSSGGRIWISPECLFTHHV
jgi:glycosyltransferase involved in cell wall biosynthesis